MHRCSPPVSAPPPPHPLPHTQKLQQEPYTSSSLPPSFRYSEYQPATLIFTYQSGSFAKEPIRSSSWSSSGLTLTSKLSDIRCKLTKPPRFLEYSCSCIQLRRLPIRPLNREFPASSSPHRPSSAHNPWYPPDPPPQKSKYHQPRSSASPHCHPNPSLLPPQAHLDY